MNFNIEKIKREEFKNTIFRNLLFIEKGPEVLNYIGDIFLNDDYKIITVIGSRRHSTYAKQVIQKVFSELRGQKIIIVSGLARGIDSIAHQEAIKNNLKTVAFPGSGLDWDVIYPKINLGLAKEIVNNGGVLVSEFDNNFLATKWSFPKRNRLMAAIADLVLVVEAQEKSGSLITARLALEYNKDLAVVPNSIFSDFSKGSNKLLRDGAYPIFTAKDILDLLGINVNLKEQVLFNFEDLSNDEKLILKKLSEPKTKDELLDETGLDITVFSIGFSSLEIKGLIKQEMGKVYKKI